MKVFDDVRVRFALRASLVGIAALLVGLQAGQSFLDALVAGLLAALSYAGIGAALPQVEPSIGVKK